MGREEALTKDLVLELTLSAHLKKIQNLNFKPQISNF